MKTGEPVTTSFMEFWLESKGVWERFIGGGVFELGHEGQKFHRLKWWKNGAIELHKQYDIDKKGWAVVKDPWGQLGEKMESGEIMEERTSNLFYSRSWGPCI